MSFMASDHAAGPAANARPSFLLASGEESLCAHGLRHRLQPGPIDSLAQRTRAHFAGKGARSADGDSPGILVGAVPFDRNAEDFLFQPDTLSRMSPQSFDADLSRYRWQAEAEPSRAHYEASVRLALALIANLCTAERPLTKIVLSRSLRLTADAPVDATALYQRLGSDPDVTRFLTELPPAANGAARQLTGATPELLIRKSGASIRSHPLAGSARRSADAGEDRAAAERLLQSQKDRREHRWVVEAILDGLSPYCSNLMAPDDPSLVSTRSMWHLGTRIEGLLRDPEAVSVAQLVSVLHPTPAVGGTPRDKALTLIPELEHYDRGFYAGAVGWMDQAGDGAWYVSLRCAEVSGCQVRVYAGAGIVDGSVPAEEAEETSAKLQAVLRALGVDEDGHAIARLRRQVAAAACR